VQEPTAAELLRSLHGLQEAFLLVREELARQDERMKSVWHLLESLRNQVDDLRRTIAQRQVEMRSDDFRQMQAVGFALRSDVDRLLHVIKPGEANGLQEDQKRLSDRVLRLFYGASGVLFVLGLAGTLLGLLFYISRLRGD